ncbi:MAG TPA: DinB family protein [Pyrinomonadaceae bacterium]|nr:DinB family protein [Pyrinomonadaceae bacterium]
MNDLLAWALQKARKQTLTLVEDLSDEQMSLQSVNGENHPTWILGHLLLGDIYLLSLLKVQELSEDFSKLLTKYGPGTTPISSAEFYDSKKILVERLTQTNELRVETVRQMKIEDLAEPIPDKILAQTQPTIGHHLQTLVFHEGHHAGQLSAWRKTQGISAIKGAFAPEGF